MVFLLIFLILILIIFTIRIKFELKNFKFTSIYKKHLDKKYEIKITIYIFTKIPIFRIKINNQKIQKIIKNEKIRSNIQKQKDKIIKNRKDINRESLKTLENIKIEIDEMNLKITIGTENASLTAFIIPIISTILAMFLSKKVNKYNNKQIFSITPIYINQNLINIEFSGIFQIKVIHIINTICILKKKRKGDINERTSNRRSYDYGYE